jgi:large subunit ribosomal protein L16
VLSPKRVKWRRQFRGNYSGFARRGSEISFGEFAIITTQAGRITSRQIEASRIAISRSVKRGGKLWIRIFPHLPVTKKPAEVRMGSGKGSPEYWAAKVQPGRVLFEINGVSREQAEEAFRLASNKLPLKTKFIVKE